MRPLTIAVPKGRIIKTLAPLFERAGLDTAALLADDRRLIRESADGKYRFLLLKPDDVPTYVEYGTADLGVSGRDTLLERRYDLYQPLDLKVGQFERGLGAFLDQRDGARQPLGEVRRQVDLAAAQDLGDQPRQPAVVGQECGGVETGALEERRERLDDAPLGHGDGQRFHGYEAL